MHDLDTDPAATMTARCAADGCGEWYDPADLRADEEPTLCPDCNAAEWDALMDGTHPLILALAGPADDCRECRRQPATAPATAADPDGMCDDCQAIHRAARTAP